MNINIGEMQRKLSLRKMGGVFMEGRPVEVVLTPRSLPQTRLLHQGESRMQ